MLITSIRQISGFFRDEFDFTAVGINAGHLN